MSKIFGANWKTSVSGIGSAIFGLLTMLAALPYDLGNVATIISPEWKGKIVTVGIIATLALRVWNSLQQKDKNTTGGTVQQTADGSVASRASQADSSSVIETQQAAPKP
jgi:hypothetical protein